MAGTIIAALTVTAMAGTITLVRLLRNISGSVGVAAPTDAMLKEEDASKCALFRHFPSLSKTLAWRSLGAAAETPIHKCTMPSRDEKNSDKKLEFFLKREDLISTTQYGGNKVRTLQHQLAVCESKRESGQKAFQHLVSLGSGGSNQVLACVVYARKLGWDNAPGGNTIMPFWFDSDEPDLDNTLNMLSVLSFPTPPTFDWGTKVGPLTMIKGIRSAWTQTQSIPMMLGGNCPTGVLGQASGILELAEQIGGGESPDVERIYLPLGSGCTTAGLVLGTVLAHHLGLKALSHPDFKIVACNVHDGMATMDRFIGLHKNPALKFMPLTITHSVAGACRALKEVGGPDVLDEAMKFIQTNLDIRDDADVVGKYGGHSELSREAAKWYDEKGEVTNFKSGRKEKELWMCGHFVSKAVVPLMNDLEAAAAKNTEGAPEAPKYMLWMTKSAVQPRGSVEEWPKFQQYNATVKKWADDGKAESTFRPGRVSTVGGKPEDYRSIMTQII
mmetsp:Transcript_15463/g.44431  ORF Transcript_15463/g.44431 Transcript_15463/m.44431 type:complete len:501 (-) Transcript_15463:41-1543(-)